MSLPQAVRHPLRSLVAVVIAALVLVPAFGVGAAPSGDTKSERDRVRRERAAVAAEVDALKATDAEVSNALDALNANVRAQQAALEDATRASAAADAELVEATAEVAAKEGEIAMMQQQLRDLAVEAFIHPPTQSGFQALEAEDMSEAEIKGALLDAKQAQDTDILDQMERAREDLQAAKDRATNAAAAAQATKQKQASALSSVTAARNQQEAKAAEVQNRLDARLAEVASLASLDQNLSNKLAAEQAALAARLPATRPPSGGGSRPPLPSGGNIVTVRGIQVHESIADNLDRMLGAASADGISLSGGGYRSPQAQIETRRRNCGTSDYAIYEMPPSQCSPPTARPGTSMHERGLAIDFTYGGRVINSRSSPAYQWLAGHAASYGFYNLPSEPWHWSTNGQ
jgi:LAS superfamily LD-carboxypeptidase LdcB